MNKYLVKYLSITFQGDRNHQISEMCIKVNAPDEEVAVVAAKQKAKHFLQLVSVTLLIPQICKNCHWWKPGNFEFQGECRRHPPQLATYTQEGNSQKFVDDPDRWPTTHSTTMFPSTQDTDWCGEFKEKSSD